MEFLKIKLYTIHSEVEKVHRRQTQTKVKYCCKINLRQNKF